MSNIITAIKYIKMALKLLKLPDNSLTLETAAVEPYNGCTTLKIS